MREVKFILPITGTPVSESPGHVYARRRLLDKFAGFTEQMVSGQWVDNDGRAVTDHSIQYTCAIDSRGQDIFRDIAVEAARLEGQTAVYVVDAAGKVGIIYPTKRAKTARIVRPNPAGSLSPHQRAIMHEPETARQPRVDEIWLSRDGLNKVLLIGPATDGTLYGRVIKGSYASPVAQILFNADGTHHAGFAGMDLVKLVATI